MGAFRFAPGQRPGCSGSVALQFSGAATQSGSIQLSWNKGYGSATFELQVTICASHAPSLLLFQREQTSITCTIPREIATHPFSSPRHFSPTSFCFVLSHFGGLSWVQESKYETKPEVGSRGPWRHQVLSCTPCCCQAPCPPLALMAQLSGQLLYWHNLRPETGPECCL